MEKNDIRLKIEYMEKAKIGFIGAGGIARAHAYSLEAMKYYYSDIPELEFESVTSLRKESREQFAVKYGFRKAQDINEFSQNNEINTVLILGPNNVHSEHLKLALEMPEVKHIYLEKPVCASVDEEKAMLQMLDVLPPYVNIQIGFQYLQTPSVREALNYWKSGIFGKPIHFDLKYYHSDYLQPGYRKRRQTRLTPAPDGGAMADLGSHGVSLLMAFFGENLQLTGALQGGSFKDVPDGSDLFSSISMVDPDSHAVGHLSASRISSGTGDLIDLEIYSEKGTLKYSSGKSDYFEYFLEESGNWTRQAVGSNYHPITSFPSGHVPPGWLRAMVHAHYVFLTGKDTETFIPDLRHGLAVQRIVRETAEQLGIFRKNFKN